MTYARCSGVSPRDRRVRRGPVRPRRRVRVQLEHRHVRVPRSGRAAARCVSTAAGALSASMYAQPLRRVRRVQRHVRAARLEHGQQRDHHLQARAPRRSPPARPAARPARGGGAPAGWPARSAPRSVSASPSKTTATASGVRAACASKSSWMHDSPGYAASVAFHASTTGARSSAGRSASRSTRPVVVRDHLLQHAPQVAQRSAPPSPRSKSAVAYVTRAHDAPVRLAQRQRQVELRRRPRVVQRVHGRRAPSPGSCQPARRRRVLPGEHHLEERAVRQAAHGLHQLHHLLEGDVLVLLRLQRPLLHPRQQLRHRGRARQVHAQRQRVDEEADQPLDLRAARGWPWACRSPRPSWPDEPAQHRGPPGQQRHEQRGAVPPAERLEPRRQLLVQLHAQPRARVVQLRRARVVGGQLQQLRARRRASRVQYSACSCSTSPSTQRRCHAA